MAEIDAPPTSPRSTRPGPVVLVLAILSLQILALRAGADPPAQAVEDASSVADRLARLRDPATSLEARVASAGALVDAGDEEATAALLAALSDHDLHVTVAVLSALVPRPARPDLASAVVDAAEAAPSMVGPMAAIVLADLPGGLLGPLRDRTEAVDRPTADRVRSIALLPWAEPRGAATVLIGLLEHGTETPEVEAAAMGALGALTGRTFEDRTGWLEWWSASPGLSVGAHALGEHAIDRSITAWSRRLDDARTRSSTLETRLVETYRELFRQPLSPDRVEVLVLRLLGDPLVALRGLALERVERAIRDGPVPESVRAAIANLVTDEDPSLRRRALVLADRLNVDGFDGLLARRLNDEIDAAVLRTLLEILGRRPVPGSGPRIAELFLDDRFGPEATEALWCQSRQDDIVTTVPTTSPEWAGAEVRSVMAERLAERPDDPRLLRLAIVVARSDDLGFYVDRLDADDPSVRTAAAEGLGRRQALAPLQARCDDPERIEIRGPLVSALGRGPATLERARLLLALAPTAEGNGATWAQAARGLLPRLSPDAVLHVDRELSELDHPAGDDLRCAILVEAVRLGLLTTPPLIDDGLLLRAAERIAAIEDAVKRRDHLGRVTELDVDAEAKSLIDRLTLNATVLAGDYVAAAGAADEPAAWLAILERLVAAGDSRAAEVRDEIERRFAERLEDDHRSSLDALSARIRGDDRAAEGNGTASEV